jgi:hypothetical protein
LQAEETRLAKEMEEKVRLANEAEETAQKVLLLHLAL